MQRMFLLSVWFLTATHHVLNVVYLIKSSISARIVIIIEMALDNGSMVGRKVFKRRGSTDALGII